MSSNTQPAKKQRRQKKKYDSFKSFTNRLRTQILPDVRLSGKTVSMIDTIINTILAKLAKYSSMLLDTAKEKTIGADTIISAVRLMGTSAANVYLPMIDAGLAAYKNENYVSTYKGSRVTNIFKLRTTVVPDDSGIKKARFSKDISVALSSFIDAYITQLLAAADATKNQFGKNKETVTIQPWHLKRAIESNPVFSDVISGSDGLIYVQGGVTPYILPELLTTTKAGKKSPRKARSPRKAPSKAKSKRKSKSPPRKRKTPPKPRAAPKKAAAKKRKPAITKKAPAKKKTPIRKRQKVNVVSQ